MLLLSSTMVSLQLILTSLLASTTLAILPLNEDRFISKTSYKVSSVQLPAKGFENYLETLTDSSDTTGLSKSTTNSQKSTASNSTILNLKPGITTLQTDENNECYFVNATIGKKEFPLIIDTGSAYLWVYGDDCTNEACDDKALYTPASSETATSTFALAYVTGTASGEVVEDNIIVNKLATTQKFKFGMADTVPDFFKNYPVSGIFGLPSNDSTAIQSIISALYDSHAISIEKFSISLGEVSNSTDYPNEGIFAIGDPIEELYEGDISYSDLIENESHYWLIAIDSVSLDSFQINFTDSVTLESGSDNSSVARKAIIDSGTTVLALPKQDALDVHSYFTDSITDGTNFAIYCNSSLDLILDINGEDWTIKPESYLGEEYSESSGLYGYCVSNIQGIDSAADDSWILGSVFLKSVYAVFDVNNQQVGFANKNDDVILTSTSVTSSSSPTSTAAYYGNSSSITTSLSSNSSSSSASSSSSKGDAMTLNHRFSIYTAIVSLITMFML